MSKTVLGEVFITEKGNLGLTINIPMLLDALSPLNPIEALFDASDNKEPDPNSQTAAPEDPQQDTPPEQGNSEPEGDAPSEPVDGIDLFAAKDLGGKVISGALEDLNGRAEIKEMMDWLKHNNFNYRNFCRYLRSIESLAGHPLACPLIGTTTKGDPSLYKLATRYYHWWKGNKQAVKKDYEMFLDKQLSDLGIAIEMVKKEFDGIEIDPENLPEGMVIGK